MNSELEPDQDSATPRKDQPEKPADALYLYEDSGILEKHGSVPLWLVAVVVILFIWGIYYLVAFWAPPG